MAGEGLATSASCELELVHTIGCGTNGHAMAPVVPEQLSDQRQQFDTKVIL